MSSSRATRCSIGGWVEKRLRRPPARNGFAIIRWAVLASWPSAGSGIAVRAGLDLAQRGGQRQRVLGQRGAGRVGLELAAAARSPAG